MSEQSAPDFPAGWVEATVGDVAEYINGMAFKPSDWERHGRPIIRIQNLSGSNPAFNFTTKEVEEKYVVPPETILVSWSATLDTYLWDGPEAVLNQHIFKVVPHDVQMQGFVFWLLRNAIAEMRRSAHLHGSTMKHINRGPFLAHQVHLPPINEQKRIVAKIEALQERSEAAKEALDAIPPLLEKFRQSVLAAAFRGDLTKAWRAQNPDVEPATELLKRIRAERRARWIEDAAEKARAKAEAKAAKAGKPWSDEDDAKVLEKERVKAAKKYKEPEPVDASNLPELPEGWCWARLEDLTPAEAAIVYGIIQPGPQITDGVIYVRPADIAGPNRLKTDLPRTSPEIAAKYERASLAAGDLVFSIVGTIGKWFITPPELAGANITQSAVRIRPTAPLDGEFLVRALQTMPVEHQMNRLMFGNAVQRLNVAHVRGLCIPLPPDGEREELVRIVRAAFDGIASVAEEAASKGRLVASLNQSILAKAFRGELVPQDPEDEPASALLERIRAEREAAAPKKKRGRGRRTSAG